MLRWFLQGTQRLGSHARSANAVDTQCAAWWRLSALVETCMGALASMTAATICALLRRV
jgi:hypothetical protein